MTWFSQPRNPSIIHIAMTLDTTYLRGSIAGVFSVLQHATCPENIVFHFLATHRRAELGRIVLTTFPYLNFHLYHFDTNLVKGKISSSIRRALDQPLNYARFSLADLLPTTVNRIIYCDSDLIVVDDIAKLWTINLNSNVLGAPEYCHANFTNYFTPNGVMVIDLEKWREGRYTNKLESWMRIQKRYRIYDLGSLPPFLLVFAGNVEGVEHRWNQHGLGGDNVEGLCRDLHPGPVSLLHWSGKGKPWLRLDSRKPCPLESLWAPFLTTSSPDNLDGLIDPDLNFPGNESFSLENSQVQSVLADEFAFLQDSLLEPGDDCSSSKEKIDSGKCSNDAFLIWNAILNNNDNFGDKTQKFLRQFREKLNESLVVDLLNLIQNAELGEKFIIWAGRQIGYTHTVPVYNALLDVLGCNKDDRVSEHILKEIKDDDKEDFALRVFEQKKAGSGDYSYAYKLLKKMVHCGCQPGYVVYNILIGGICGNEELPSSDVLELAEQAYSEMLDAGVVLNKINVCNFARCLCGAGKFEKAYNVIREMMSKGYIPDSSTYSKVIGFLCNASKVEKAFLLFEEMKRNGKEVIQCPPNVVIYTVMIDGLCKVGKTDEAYKLMLMMEEKGCHPNVVTYTAMIDGFWKAGKVDKCLELFRQMGARGCAPNYVTYRVLINHCCAAGLLDEAHQLLEEMKQTYWPRHMASYRKVIEGFNREFMVNLGLLEEISENDSAPIVPVYRILIESFCKAGRLEAALALLREISSFSHFLSDDRIMYSSLIESLSLSCGRKHLNLHMAYVTWISIGYLMQIHVKETESCNLMDGSDSGGLLFMSSNTEIKKITSVGILDLKKRALFFAYHYIDLSVMQMQVGDAARTELIRLVLVNLVVADYFNLGSGYLLVILISLNIKCCCYSILFLLFSL
ncbi:hypothetical protein F0562_033996 [Nyssa sinensis]|uniref:PROP1-like PPR domain-containing protein n=1 Tax=Nyssa sinensis TaxID=561372 RepID=A0A5J5ADW0_9ASTE|nr:hypothetical protein F0562_033996 [Nyssa sinensis]